MSLFFLNFHKIVSQRKIVFGTLLLFIVGFSIFMLTRLELQEDISVLIPEDERVSDIQQVLSNNRFASRIIIYLTHKEKSKADPDQLIQAANAIAQSLKKDTTYIDDVSFGGYSQDFPEIYDFIYQNLPLYLSDEDYENIEEMLAAESIEKAIKANHKSLSSLVGIVTKEYIFKDPLSITTLALRQLENYQLDDNFIIHQGSIFTKDKRNLLVFVQPAKPSSDTKANARLIEYLDELLISIEEEYPEILYGYYGGTAVAVANAKRIKQDITITVSIALVLLSLLFFFVFRRFVNILLVFLPITLGILIALAAMSLTGVHISAIALGVGALLIGISLDYALHAFAHYRNEQSVASMLKGISKPIIMSCLSTASAFLTLSVVQSKALNQMGLFSAIAIVVTALMVLLLMPFMMKYVRFTKKADSQKNIFPDNIAAYAFDKNKYLFFAIVILSIIFLFTSRNLSFNSDISALNYVPPHLKKAEQHLNKISTQAQSAVFLVVHANSYDDALSKTEQQTPLFEQALHEEIISSYTLPTTLVLSAQKQQERIYKWHSFWDKADREQIIKTIQQKSQAYHFHKNAFDSFYNLLHKDFTIQRTEDFEVVKKAFLADYLTQANDTYTAISVVKVSQDNKNKLFEKFADNKDVVIFDNQHFTNRFLEVLTEDFRRLVVISMIVVFSVLLLFFGRIEIALIAFFPVMLSWLWTIGIMGLLGIEFNIFNIVISTFILGLGVDYSIFIVSGLLHRYKYGTGQLTPYKLSVLLSALTTILCLGVMIFAQHPALRSIAFVSIAGIASVITITYVVLPKMFFFLTQNKGIPRKEPVTLLNFIISIVTLFVFLFGVTLASVLLVIIRLLPIRKKSKQYLIHVIICVQSRIIVYLNFTIKKRYINKHKLDFSKPAVLVSNHQSHLDLVLLFLLHPKIVAVTNNWVWHSPFFGHVLRYAGFYPAFKGIDGVYEKISEKVAQGYSVLVFPEGSRSDNGKIRRFHQGAFFLADQLKLDIQPILIHGAMHALGKNEFFLKSAVISIRVFDRIKVKPADISQNITYKDQAKSMAAFYRKKYADAQKEFETPAFVKKFVRMQYIYKSPFLEWYVRVKLKLEDNYTTIHQHLPSAGKIMDIGCGYGYMALMLSGLSENRTIKALDYDSEKIKVANNCAAKTDNVTFINADIFDFNFEEQDAFVLSDVLHYFNKDKQRALLKKCIEYLKPGGLIIIRDGDSSMHKKHLLTKYTEFFSTRSGLNKAKEGQLFFTSRNDIQQLFSDNGLKLKIEKQSKLTSNLLYIAQA